MDRRLRALSIIVEPQPDGSNNRIYEHRRDGCLYAIDYDDNYEIPCPVSPGVKIKVLEDVYFLEDQWKTHHSFQPHRYETDRYRGERFEEEGFIRVTAAEAPHWSARFMLQVHDVRLARASEVRCGEAIRMGLCRDLYSYRNHYYSMSQDVDDLVDEMYGDAKMKYKGRFNLEKGGSEPVYHNGEIVAYESYDVYAGDTIEDWKGKPLICRGNPYVWVLSVFAIRSGENMEPARRPHDPVGIST